MSPYAVSKLACEGFCRSFWHVYGLECVALRYFNVFGPRQDPASEYAAVIPRFIAACLNGTSPIVYGDGEQSRDFIYIDNVIDANMQALEADAVAGNAYNVACGEGVTLNSLLSTLRGLIGTDVQPDYRDERVGDVRHSLADVTRVRQELGFSPQVTLREGLRRTIAAFGGSDSTVEPSGLAVDA